MKLLRIRALLALAEVAAKASIAAIGFSERTGNIESRAVTTAHRLQGKPAPRY